MMSTDLSGVVDPEDREIVEKLAKLQRMYNQVSVFNSLLFTVLLLLPVADQDQC